MPAKSDEFLGALRRWPSGVTVVTMGRDDTAHGLTVSSFASVTLSPPTILVCINAASRAHKILEDSPVFAVNILSAGQRALSEYFARAKGVSPLEQVPHRMAHTVPCPVLEDAAAVLECRIATSVAVGSHVTYFGAVEHTDVSDRDPLLYYNGGYQEAIFGRRTEARVTESAGGTTRIDRLRRP